MSRLAASAAPVRHDVKPDRYMTHAQKLRAIREERDPVVQAWAIRALIPPSNTHEDSDASALRRFRNAEHRGPRNR